MKNNKNQPSDLDGLKGIYHKAEEFTSEENGVKLHHVVLSLNPRDDILPKALSAEDAKRRYKKLIRQLIEQFRRGSLICDLHIGMTSGRTGDDLEDEDLYLITGEGGIMDSVLDALESKKISGVDILRICSDLVGDLRELVQVDLRSVTAGELRDTSALVQRTIDHFNLALDVYVDWELSRGGISHKIENPMLIRYYLMASQRNYDPSRCEYRH